MSHRLTTDEAILRCARRAYADHAPHDILERFQVQETWENLKVYEDDAVPRTDAMRLTFTDRAYTREDRQTYTFGHDLPMLSVQEIAASALVLGPSKKFETEYARPDAIVIRVVYAAEQPRTPITAPDADLFTLSIRPNPRRSYIADYEVPFDSAQPPYLWAD